MWKMIKHSGFNSIRGLCQFLAVFERILRSICAPELTMELSQLGSCQICVVNTSNQCTRRDLSSLTHNTATNYRAGVEKRGGTSGRGKTAVAPFSKLSKLGSGFPSSGSVTNDGAGYAFSSTERVH
jgi:hypothetical protein